MDNITFPIALIIISLIVLIGKSIRIYQFKNYDKSKIDSIGKYEEKSKIRHYVNVLFGKKKDE